MMFQHVSRLGVAVAALMLLTILAIAPARAQIGSDRYSSMVIDASTGRVLLGVNADEPRHPASLTKMMTLYMVFEALRDRRIALDEPVPVSPHAASMEPSKLGLVPGMHITVQEAILGIVTKSANDAAAALGEMLGGSEDRFALMMTLRARALGMTHTEYHNASGLPDPNQWTTARDLTTLARHLIQDYPTEYRYFSTPGFRFHGRIVMGHDHMLENYPGTDGIKTGYTDASGFNMVTSAVHSGVRLVGVVMGAAHAGAHGLAARPGFRTDGCAEHGAGPPRAWPQFDWSEPRAIRPGRHAAPRHAPTPGPLVRADRQFSHRKRGATGRHLGAPSVRQRRRGDRAIELSRQDRLARRTGRS
jgi:D-alanyl-D-alanine carboxypeptidase